MTESRTVAASAPTTPRAEQPLDERAFDVAAPVVPTTEQLQRQVYELVRARVLESIGGGGNWTVAFRRSSDTDTFFSDTMADMIAWDVAAQLLPPTVPNRARLG